MSLFYGDVSLKPFKKTSVVQDMSATLSTIIWRGAVCASEMMKYADSDINLVRANNDLDVLQLLSLTLLVFIEEEKSNNPLELCLLFDQTCPLITKKKNAVSTLMAASNPSKAFLSSKFTVDAVAEFQVGHKNAQNKETLF